MPVVGGVFTRLGGFNDWPSNPPKGDASVGMVLCEVEVEDEETKGRGGKKDKGRGSRAVRWNVELAHETYHDD